MSAEKKEQLAGHDDGRSHVASDRSSESSDHDVESGRGVADDPLERYSTHHSQGPDITIEPISSVIEIPDEVYDRLTPGRKLVLVALLSFCAFLAPVSSTSVLSATPEVAAEYGTDGSIINLVNAMYMLMMGISPMVWGPLSQVYGRKWISVVTSIAFCGCSIGTALAPNLGAFFVFRMLTAFEGTSFLLIGAAVISDIYRPTERGTATGWFFSGTLVGPALGPFLGGIIVTYTSWRVIFWLQTGLSVLAVLGTFFVLPETIYHKKIDDLEGYSGVEKMKTLWGMINPIRVVRLMRYPNLIIIGLSSSSLVWNMYSLLTPIRYVINPRYNLTSPLQGGLFYLAPGAGYLLGTFGGGRLADYVVKRYMKKRGERIAEDRLYSSLPFSGIVIPACMLIYGWAVEKDVGGIPLTVIVLFLQGVAQLFCFPSLNTYCLDVMPGRGAEVIAGNYALRYLFACLGTAVVLPAVEAIGVGWFCTISAAFLVLATLGTYSTIIYGKGWRESVDAKKKAKRLREINERHDNHTDEDAHAEASSPTEPITEKGKAEA